MNSEEATDVQRNKTNTRMYQPLVTLLSVTFYRTVKMHKLRDEKTTSCP